MTGPPREPGKRTGRIGQGPVDGPGRHRQPPGTEPVTARSPLRLRAGMSAIALVAGTVAAVLFMLDERGDGGPGSGVAAVICAVLALIALIDLIVIARRFRS
jgi:hypothetical protein